MLTLQIVSYQKNDSQQPSNKTLDTGVLTIGRDKSNDWSLSDPDRILSKMHCTLESSDNSYFLKDTSTNGVYVNSSSQVLGRGNTVAIENGDTIRFGDYEVSAIVDIKADEPFATVPVSPVSQITVPNIPPPPPPLDIDNDSSDWKAILEPNKPMSIPEQQTDDHAVDVPEFAQSHYDAPTVGFNIPDDWGGPDDEHDTSTPEQDIISQPAQVQPIPDMTPPAPVPEPVQVQEQMPVQVSQYDHQPVQEQMPVQVSQFDHQPVQEQMPGQVSQYGHQPAQTEIPEQLQRPSSSSGNLTQAFLNGAGLDAGINLTVSEEELMTELGGLFKKMTSGLIGVLAARGDIKSEFRLSQTTIRPTENNPLKFSLNVEEAMLALINKRGQGYMAADAAFDEAFDDIKAHQVAVLSGMQSALQGVLIRFDPAKIEAGNKQASSMQKMLRGQKSKFWDDFVSLYANIRSEAEEDFQNIFGREFAKAYDQQIQKQKNS